MNILTLISFILAIGVFFAGLYLSSPELGMFYDTTSLFIVVGGSIAATAIAFRLNKILIMFKVFMLRVLGANEIKTRPLVTEIILAIDHLKKGKSLNELVDGASDFFFKEALMLVQDGLLERDDLIEVLNDRNNHIVNSYRGETSKLKAIGKFF